MKKTAIFSSALALMMVLLGSSTAEASTRYTYYPVATNYYDTHRNCTPRSSDLGLGGGVFVSGTTICPIATPRYVDEYRYDDNRNSGSHYYEEDSNDDSDYDEDEDSHYEEDEDSDYDESDYDEDDNGDDDDNNSGGSGNNW